MYSNTIESPARPVGRVRLEGASELMKNYADAALFAGDHGFVVAQDGDGEPLIFAIDERRRLIVVHRDPGGATGFARADLSAALGADLEVAAFAASQARSGAITLALALRRPGERACAVHLSPPLANDARAEAWRAAASSWVHRPSSIAHDVTAILMGTSDDDQGPPMTVVAVQGAREATHYRVNADLADARWIWAELPLPENADEILDLALGTVQGDRGVFALYRLGGQQTLTFTSLPDPEYGKVSRYEFKAPGRLRCIAALPRPEDGQSDLYAAGDGAYVFPASGSAARAIAGAPAGIDRLLVRGDREAVSLWMRAGDRLHHSGARRQDLGEWSTPTPLVHGVRHCDALRNQPRLADALFVVRAGGELEYHWRDPDAATWSAAPIGLPASDELLEFNAYTCQFTLVDDQGPLAGETLEITASERVSAALNGEVHLVDAARPVRARADLQGRLTVTVRADTLATASLTVRAPGLGVERTIDPRARVLDALAELRSGDDLARRGLGVDVSAKSRDAAAGALQRLVALGGDLGAAPTDALSFAADAPPREAWGLVFGDGEAELLTGAAAARAIASPTDALSFAAGDDAQPLSFLVDAGDFLKGLVGGAMKAAGFFFDRLGDALTLVVKIGETLFQMAIEALGHVYQAIHWILANTLGIDLDQIVKAIGFVFEWRDIVVTHDVLVNLVTETLARGEAELGKVEGAIDRFFVDLKERIRGLGRITIPGVDVDAPARAVGESLRDRSPAAADRRVDDFLAGPAGGFASYHLANGRAGAAAAAVDDDDPLQALLADLGEIWGTIEETLQTLGKGVADGLLRGGLSLGELVQMIATDAALGLLEVARTVAVKIVGLGRRLTALARSLLTAPLEIPVISGLYRKHVGGDLTILGAVALLVAAPVTVIYKILRGEAPFPFAPADAPLAFAGDADADADESTPELSSHPRHADAAERPRTRGLDTLKGAGLWTLILFAGGAAVGGAGYALYKLLSAVDRLNNMILRPLHSGIERIKEFVGPLVAPAMVVIKALIFVGKAIWLTIKTVQGAPVAETALSFARWGVSGFAVLADIIGAIDPVEKAAPVLRALVAVVDLLLAIPYGIVRIVAHAGGDDRDLIPVDVLEIIVAVADCAGTICSSAGKLCPEPTVKAVLTAVAMAETVWSLGMTVVVSVTPIVMDRPLEPIA